MRILVLSDSHGYIYNLEQILLCERSCDMIIHCGDGGDDMYTMSDFTLGKPLYTVKGNCDSIVHNFAEKSIINADGKQLFVCHGDKYGVKYGLTNIFLAAEAEHIDICIFGHTHTPLSEYENGIYIFNPGAVKDGCYGTIDINKNVITPLNKHL